LIVDVTSGASPLTAYIDMYLIGRMPINSATVDLSADRPQRAEGYPPFWAKAGLTQRGAINLSR
jgi:hypothetical protein